jgi:hypothetical protein
MTGRCSVPPSLERLMPSFLFYSSSLPHHYLLIATLVLGMRKPTTPW